MDDLLATNPVALLPQGILSVGQRLADVVITYLDSKAEAELAFHFRQPTAASIGVITKILSELGYLKRVEGKMPWALWYYMTFLTCPFLRLFQG